MNLSQHVKITKLDGAVASAGADHDASTIVDMQGYDGVLFMASIDTANVANGIKAEQGEQTNLSDGADLEGSLVLSDGTQTDLVLDLYRPLERYVRPVVVRGAATGIDAIWAIQYAGSHKPDLGDATAQALKLVISPDEGVA